MLIQHVFISLLAGVSSVWVPRKTLLENQFNKLEASYRVGTIGWRSYSAMMIHLSQWDR